MWESRQQIHILTHTYSHTHTHTHTPLCALSGNQICSCCALSYQFYTSLCPKRQTVLETSRARGQTPCLFFRKEAYYYCRFLELHCPKYLICGPVEQKCLCLLSLLFFS